MTLLKILCFNIHGGHSRDGQRDLRRVNALLDSYDIDIGCFQEMETRAKRGGAAGDIDVLAGPHRPHRLHGPTMTEGDGWYGNLIVSRHDITRGLAHSMETTFDFEPRNAVDATIQTPLGKIRILNTHLSLSPWERQKEVPKLVELVNLVEEEERAPVLLMGDLNEWRRRSRLLKFLDEKMVAVPCGASFPSVLPVFKLDRIWHDRPGLDISAKILDGREVRILSDHLPLLIEISSL